jgi:hypothetical protein
MHDPRTPEILAGLEAMPREDRPTMMRAMSFTFPLLKNDRDWQARIDEVLATLDPTAVEHADIIVKAGRMSTLLKAELVG